MMDLRGSPSNAEVNTVFFDDGVRRLETTDLDGFEPNFVDLLKLYASMANGATVKSGRALVACGKSYSF